MVGFSFCLPFMRLYLRDELGVTDEIARARWAGLLVAVSAVVMFFAAPLWGAFSDRVGRKVMVMRAMFGGAVVIGLMGAVTSPWQLLALRIAQGAVTGTITASAALVSGVTPTRRAGFSMGMMQAAVFAGNAVGPLLGGTCIDIFGYRPTFYLAAAMLLAGGVFVTALAEEGAAHPRELARTSASSVEPGGASPPKRGFLDVLRSPGFAVFVTVLFVMSFSRMLPAPVFQEYVELLHGRAAGVNTRAGILISTRCAVAALTSVGVGWLATRVSLAVLLAGGIVLAGLLAVPLSYASSLTQVLLLHVGLGFSGGLLGPALGRLVHRSVPRASHGKAYGIVQSANCAGWGLGPLVGGHLNAELMLAYGRETGLRMPYAVAGAFQVLAGIACWVMLKSGMKEKPPPDTAA